MDHLFCFFRCFYSCRSPALGVPDTAASYHLHVFCKGDGHYVNGPNKKTYELVVGFFTAG